MFSTIVSSFCVIFLILFIGLCVFLAWKNPKTKRARQIWFLILFGGSFVFVSIFIFCILGFGYKTTPQFLEIGQYYPLTSLTGTSQTITIGDESRQGQVDYVLDSSCKNKCFTGQINLQFIQQGNNESNRLNWVNSDDLVDKIFIVDANGKKYSDGKQGIEVKEEKLALSLVWLPPDDETQKRNPVRLAFFIDLNPPDAAPRFVIEHIDPKPVSLAETEASEKESEDNSGQRSVIYLTSSKQTTTLQKSGSKNYIPILQVGKNGEVGDINALLERSGNGEDNCINNGLQRNCFASGIRSYAGTDRGIVFTILSIDRSQPWVWFLVCLILWSLVGFFHFRYLISGVEINAVNSEITFERKVFLRAENLFIFLSAVQMLLAFRLVLCLRVYLWAPYNAKAVETILFSLIVVPLLIFFGCYAFELRRLGKGLNDDGFKEFIQEIVRFPPVIFWFFSLIIYYISFYILKSANNIDITGANFAFQNFEWSYYLLLVFVPLGFLAIGFLIDQYYRSMASNETRYINSTYDPITYALTEGKETDALFGINSTSLTWKITVGLIGIALFSLGILLAFKFGVSGRWSQVPGALGILLSGLTLYWFYRRGKKTENLSQTWLAFLSSLSFICFAVFAVIILRIFLPPLNTGRGISAASLAAGINIRTNTVFEILILIFTMRILRAFFVSWRKVDESFGWRGAFDMALLFIAPAIMLAISFTVSHDYGAAYVHLPAMIGLLLLITGSWSIWKHTSGRGFFLYSLVFPFLVITVYLVFIFSTMAVNLMDPHDFKTHRYMLLQGQDSALEQSHIGGKSLLNAIEQQWRMNNYASAGGLTGTGYGQSPIADSGRFQDISMDDIVFDVYVLSEFGAFGGLALIGLYGLIFFLMIKLAWSSFREEGNELSFALAGGLALMIFFPAIYMAGANVNTVLFTGQNLPLLNLRSYTEILRSGIVLMLFATVLQPLSPKRKSNIKDSRPSALEILRHTPVLLITLIRRGQGAKSKKLTQLGYKDMHRLWTAGTVILTNICLITFILIGFSIYAPIRGIFYTSNNEDYLQDLDYTSLKDVAVEQISKGNIWFEPLQEGETKPGKCRGRENKNKNASSDKDPFTAYQLCIEKNVAGGAEGDTLNALIKEWNSAKREARGNDKSQGIWNDGGLFFQLNVDDISQQTVSIEKKITVNQSSFNVSSPFRPQRGWNGALTEANAIYNDGGVLVGSGVVLPLIAVPYESKEGATFVGATDPGPVRVNLDSPETYQPKRGFSISETESKNPIFEIATVKGAEGAVLRSFSGDFNLFINGSPLLLNKSTDSQGKQGTAPMIRLDDGDVIAYTKRENTNPKQIPQHVFVYNQARLGTFSLPVWVNGKMQRFYPQGDSFYMAKQITDAVNLTSKDEENNKDIAITIKASLNREVYELIKRWRACLDGTADTKNCRIEGFEVSPRPIKSGKRRMSVTLMDTNTGDLLALASDYGEIHDPNDLTRVSDPKNDYENLNLSRHIIGSAIKPFTASASLYSFSDLYKMTLKDSRSNKMLLFGMPVGGSRSIAGHKGSNLIEWSGFIPPSDNLYALTLAMLGMCDTENGRTLPRFERNGNFQSPSFPLYLELTDSGTSLGKPEWSPSNMFNSSASDNERQINYLETTPLASNLDDLFDTRARKDPQKSSYANSMWAGVVKDVNILNKPNPFDKVSPEITNFALADITNFTELRSVLLGGGFNPDEALAPYGNIGGQWSNVFLAQSMARIVTGKKITSQILAKDDLSKSPVEEWFPGAANSQWREALLYELEDVVYSDQGTAHSELIKTISSIGNNSKPVSRSGKEPIFTIFSKTGTLNPQGEGVSKDKKTVEDYSVFVFTVGIWNDKTKSLERSVSGAISIEQGGQGQSQAFAAALIELLNRQPQFRWGKSKK